MIYPSSIKDLPLPPVSEKEALRYARTNESDKNSVMLLTECIREAGLLKGKVSYCTLPVKIQGEKVDLGAFSLSSQCLSDFLKGSEKTVLFAATIGLDFDRLITKYNLLSPSKALMFQALGAERVEALCDHFCDQIKKEYSLEEAPRFSPGYGDLSLSIQKDIISLLGANKNLGVFVNDSFLLSPSKTVTAFIKIPKSED